MAEKFNEFFSPIGLTIARGVPLVETPPTDYLPVHNPDILFDIGNINTVHIVDLLKSLPRKTV